MSTLEKNYGQYVVFLKALADETRLKIITMLSYGELCACNILEFFQITQPTLSYHMKILCESGLVNGRRDGVWMRYSLDKKNLTSLRALFNDIEINIDQNSCYNEKC